MVSPCLPAHMAVVAVHVAVHAPLHLPAFCLDQLGDSRGAPRYLRIPSLPRSPWFAVRHILCLSMPQSGKIKGACFTSCALRALAGALAPAYGTVIREPWTSVYAHKYAPRTVHVGDSLVLSWIQEYVVVLPPREPVPRLLFSAPVMGLPGRSPVA